MVKGLNGLGTSNLLFTVKLTYIRHMEWLLGLGVSAVVVVAVVVGVTRRKKPEAADTYTVTVSPDRYEPHDTPTVDIPANTSDTPADAPETEPVPAPSVPSASSAPAAADTLTVAEELSGVATSPAADVSPVVTPPPMPPVPSQSAESSEDAQDVPQDSGPSPQEDAEVEVVEPPAEETDAEVEATVVDTEVESTPQEETVPEPEPRRFVDLRDQPERQLRIVLDDDAFGDLDDAAHQAPFYVLRREDDSSQTSHAIAVLTGDHKIGVLAESAAKHYAPLFDQLDADVLAHATGDGSSKDRVFLPRVPTLRALITSGVPMIEEPTPQETPQSHQGQDPELAGETTTRELVSAGQSA